MPVLSNSKHELFAVLIAKGEELTEAHVKAGYKRNPGNASGLAYKKEIQERIKEIKLNAAFLVEISVSRVLAELGKLGFSNMADFVTIGQDGLPFVDFTHLTRDQKAAIQEITVETRMETVVNAEGVKEAAPVRKVRFKLVDKRAALADIGKHLGMFIDRHEHGGVGDFDRHSDDELADEIQRMSAEAGIDGPISETEH